MKISPTLMTATLLSQAFFHSSKRQFSQTKNLKRYALNKHMTTVGQGKRMLAENKMIDGVNEYTTDYT